MRSTNERALWRMITNTWRALIAISHAPPRPRQPGLGRGVVADDRGVDVAEPVDLGRAQEAHVDEAALEVEAEQLEHLVTAVAPVTMVGSPMESGRRAGRAPNTPAS